MLYYVVMSNAVEALMEVILIDGDGEDPVDVYGAINFQSSLFDNKIELFRRSKNNPVSMRPNNSIPL